MNIALLDYGVGNLHSLTRGFEAAGATVHVETAASGALRHDALVLPGVGGFGAASVRLAPEVPALRAALRDGFPCLGICLGMQLLFEQSEEGMGGGLAVLPGRVRKLRAPRLPHVGWNDVRLPTGGAGGLRALPRADGPGLLGSLDGLVAYFANSFIAEPAAPEDVIAVTEVDAGGEVFPSVVRRGHTWGVQFHPEKSGQPGIRVLRGFLAEVRR
jgi:imidazole glycerol-phosphate synthase subunit HisH